ncbi:MAG: thioredoxin family protein [Flavobacteriales bacterium]
MYLKLPKSSILTIFFLLFVYVIIFDVNAQGKHKKGKIHWLKWEEMVKKNMKNPRSDKKVLIKVYTDWCGWCKKMDKTTFRDPSIVNYINKNYYPVKLDAEMKRDVLFGGDTLKFIANKGRNGYHQLAAKLLRGKMSYPTTVFLDFKNKNVKYLSKIGGYQGPKKMEPILHFIDKEKYKNDNKKLSSYIKKFNNNKVDKEENKKKEQKKKQKDRNKKTHKGGDHKVNWMSWKEAIAANKKDPKKIFVDIYTKWCGPCKLLSKKTFQNDKVANYLNENFHPVKMNAEMRDTIVFRGKTYKNIKPSFKKPKPNARGKPHELALSLVDGNLAYPAIVVLNEKFQRLNIAKGFRPPKKMLKMLKHFGEEKYKKKKSEKKKKNEKKKEEGK